MKKENPEITKIDTHINISSLCQNPTPVKSAYDVLMGRNLPITLPANKIHRRPVRGVKSEREQLPADFNPK